MLADLKGRRSAKLSDSLYLRGARMCFALEAIDLSLVRAHHLPLVANHAHREHPEQNCLQKIRNMEK